MAETPPVRAVVGVAESAAEMQRLFLLDAVWTEAGEHPGPFDDAGVEAVAGLGEQVDAQFALVARQADTLRGILESYSEWVNERIANTLTTASPYGACP